MTNNQMLESEAYAQQKEILFHEVNSHTVPYSFAGKFFAPTTSMPCPSRIYFTDPKSMKQPVSLKTVKKWKKEVGKSKHHKFTTLVHITL